MPLRKEKVAVKQVKSTSLGSMGHMNEPVPLKLRML